VHFEFTEMYRNLSGSERGVYLFVCLYAFAIERMVLIHKYKITPLDRLLHLYSSVVCSCGATTPLIDTLSNSSAPTYTHRT